MPTDEILEEQTTNDSSTDDTSTAMVIPENYLRVYGKLLLLMVELGESMLHDCKSLCNAKNMPIVECYHMFKAAVAARQLAATTSTEDSNENTNNTYYIKLANTLINYVNTQLDCVTENYKDVISIGIDFNPDDLITWLAPINGTNTNTIVVPSDSNEEQNNDSNTNGNNCSCIQKSRISGFILTDVNTGTYYGLTAEQVNNNRCWIVDESMYQQFVPDTTEVYINGVRYIQDQDDYVELYATRSGNVVGVGIVLNEGQFDVYPNEDEIVVYAELIDKTEHNVEYEKN